MTQNLYAPELNDRGWYRVNRENKKLKREIAQLHQALEAAIAYLKFVKPMPAGIIKQGKIALKGDSK